MYIKAYSRKDYIKQMWKQGADPVCSRYIYSMINCSVSDPDPVGSVSLGRIWIWIHFRKR